MYFKGIHHTKKIFGGYLFIIYLKIILKSLAFRKTIDYLCEEIFTTM